MTVREKLEAFGQQEEALVYQKEDYKGTTYYTRSEDYLFPLRTEPPLVYSALNRVVVKDDRMLAAPATFIIEDLIDVREGDAPSLLESDAHLSLAREVGEGLIGGGFLAQTWIAENTIGHSRGDYGIDPDALDVYLAGPQRWGTLSDYNLALFGYRVLGESHETIIALYYPDPDAAEKDAEELKKRWDSFHVKIDILPVSDLCSPLSVRGSPQGKGIHAHRYLRRDKYRERITILPRPGPLDGADLYGHAGVSDRRPGSAQREGARAVYKIDSTNRS